MNATRERSRYRRWIDLEISGRLAPHLRSRLHDHLRANDEARAYYDRAIAAFRVLEGDREPSTLELEMVEGWLVGGLEAEPATAADPASRLPGRLGLVTAVVAAALLVWWGRPSPDGGDDLAVRGGSSAGLAIEVLCGPAGGGLEPSLEPATTGACDLGGMLGFAYRAASREGIEARRQLALFGVGPAGDVLYYAPTPAGDGPLTVRPDRWTAAPVTIRADVNHRAGRLRVFALLAPRAPDIAGVDALAAQLHPLPAAAEGDEPWHRRLPAATLASVCPDLDLCDTAELTVELNEENR